MFDTAYPNSYAPSQFFGVTAATLCLHATKMIRTQSLLLFSLCVFAIPHSLLSAQAEKFSKPNVAAPDLAAGKRMFERHCSLCHGVDGKGGRGPNLNRAQLFRAPDDTALMAIISDGIPPEMPEGWFFSEEEVANIAAYVRSLHSFRCNSFQF